MIRRALLITASRKWTDAGAIGNRLRLYPLGTVLLHGGAHGGDAIAGSIGGSLGFVVHVYPYFGDLKLRGGHARNACMFDVLLTMKRHGYVCTMEAFPLASVLDGGTRGMIQLVDRHNFHNENDRVPFRVTEG